MSEQSKTHAIQNNSAGSPGKFIKTVFPLTIFGTMTKAMLPRSYKFDRLNVRQYLYLRTRNR